MAEGRVNVENENGLPLGGNGRSIIDLGLLYASKSGAVVVGLLILPFFNRQLGPDQFGVVALILSVQVFLMLLDFGMATMVGRDLATSDMTDSQRHTTWRAAEWAISLLYLVLTPVGLLITWLWGGSLSPAEALGCILLFWALTLQNIGQSALLARHQFAEAAVVQVLGLLSRHGLTSLALVWVDSSLTCFISIQATVAILQMLVTRWRCVLSIHPPKSERLQIANIHNHAKTLLTNGKSLMLFGLAGAAVMQLDKVIISALMSPRELGPYFLATTFCITPISVFAGPVAQFFQPRLVRAFSTADTARTQRVLNQFIGSIAAFTLLPTGLIWILREPLIAIWLQNSTEAVQVAHYSAILLPGVAIGALGYIPYTLLISKKDYEFQARLSWILTTITLIAVTLTAIQSSSVMIICIVYALYHTVSTVSSWSRCVRLDDTEENVAIAAAKNTASLIAFIFGGTIFLATIVAQFNLIE